MYLFIARSLAVLIVFSLLIGNANHMQEQSVDNSITFMSTAVKASSIITQERFCANFGFLVKRQLIYFKEN